MKKRKLRWVPSLDDRVRQEHLEDGSAVPLLLDRLKDEPLKLRLFRCILLP